MQTMDLARRSGVAVGPGQTIREAAAIMEASGVGALAVVDHGALTGIVTDRDLVRRAMAKGAPLDARVDSVMSSPVVTIDAGADAHDAFAMFRSNGIRRLAIVRNGQFVGVVSIDDLLVDLAADLADLVQPVTAEVIFGHHDSPTPVLA